MGRSGWTSRVGYLDAERVRGAMEICHPSGVMRSYLGCPGQTSLVSCENQSVDDEESITDRAPIPTFIIN